MWIGPKNVLRTSEALGAAVHEGPGPGHGAQGPDYKGKVVVSRATSTHQDLWRLLCDCVDRCTTAPPQCTSPRPRGRRRSHETHAEPVPHRIPSFHIVPPPPPGRRGIGTGSRTSLPAGASKPFEPPSPLGPFGAQGGKESGSCKQCGLPSERESRFANP